MANSQLSDAVYHGQLNPVEEREDELHYPGDE